MPDGPWLTKTLRVKRRCGKSESDCSEEIGWVDETNDINHWSVGCKLVQWRVNTQYHRTLKDTPYHLVYGMHPRVGIFNLPISQRVLLNLVTEAQLIEVYCKLAEDPPSQDTAELP
jgi:hypothetical protein